MKDSPTAPATGSDRAPPEADRKLERAATAAQVGAATAVPPPPPGAKPSDGATADADPNAVPVGFELLVERKTPGLVRRFLTTQRHFTGLLFGGLTALVRERPEADRRGIGFRAAQLGAVLGRPWLDAELVALPFPVQFRRRLEILGPTYIKLGQILSLREDLLPSAITDELKNLLDRLPVVPFPRYLEIVAESLGRPIDAMFTSVDPQPVGSASIAQIHRATTVEGDDVILKVVKPGIREILGRDSTLLRLLGRFLQVFLARYQPRRVIQEFVYYTLREVDLRLEADNAESFAVNFQDEPDVVFPKIYRRYSSDRVLCMEFFDGFKPSDPGALALPQEDRERLVDLGAGAIIRMLYRDGFFHADLHPGNLIVLPGPQAGFIDLGMVGRFDEGLRRTMMYYYYCLVTGDAENAARYLAAVADAAPGADPNGFRRAVEDISRRWKHRANFSDFSLAQMILESVSIAGRFRMYFPVEMVLMVKALVTFEGVGQILLPGFDVAAVSREHINRLFIAQFSPLRFAKEGLRGAPEVVDALAKVPMLVTEGVRALEKASKGPPANPFAGLRGTLFAGFCLLAAAMLASSGLWWLAALLALLGFVIALSQGE